MDMSSLSTSRRLPAEWENSDAILLSWPHEATDWAYMLDDVTRCFVKIAEAITEEMTLVVVAPDIEVPKRSLMHLAGRRIIYCQVSTNDTWARDFGPITCFEGSRPVLLDFKFNGWGLKFPANHDNLITSKLHSAGVLGGRRENRLGFVLEGGSIESDGRGTILTTSECLLSPNRNGNLTRADIERYLLSAFGAGRMLWLDSGYLAGDDTDSHVDTLARLAPDDTILYVKCDDPADEHFEALQRMEQQLKSFTTADGRPYNLIGLPMPSPIFDENGERLPATYANFLITPRSVLLPVYGQEATDRLAVRMMSIAFPDRTVKTVDCRPLIRQHGSLHCVTMQLYLGGKGA